MGMAHAASISRQGEAQSGCDTKAGAQRRTHESTHDATPKRAASSLVIKIAQVNE
jgi:hypothetical protein